MPVPSFLLHWYVPPPSFQIHWRINSANEPSYFELLPSPIYRFEEANSSATDGAIFAAGVATDPKALILIEARDKDWWVSFARSTIMTLNINRDSKLFFKLDMIPPESERLEGKPFYVDWIGERRLNSEEIALPIPRR